MNAQIVGSQNVKNVKNFSLILFWTSVNGQTLLQNDPKGLLRIF